MWWLLKQAPTLPTWQQDSGGGAGAGAAGEGDGGQTGQAGDAAGQGAGGQSGQSGNAAATFTQADVDRIVTERLEREKQTREKAAKKQQDEEAERKAKESGELAPIVDAQRKRISELEMVEEQHEQLSGRVDALEAVVKAQVTALSKDLPQWALDAIAEKPVEQQLDYLVKHRDSILGTVGRRGNGGTPPGHGGGGNNPPVSREEAVAAQREALKQTGRYG